MDYYRPPRPRGSSMTAWVVSGILIVVGVIGLVLIVATVSGQKSTTSTTPSAQQPTTIVYSPAEQQYLRNMHALGVTDKPDSDLVAAGYRVCRDVDNGIELSSEPRRLMTQGWPMVSASRVVARAVLDLCPPN